MQLSAMQLNVIVIVSSFFLALPLQAQESWLLGSFQNKSKAVSEGERISAATGVEVLLQTIEKDSDEVYRLLVQPFSDVQDQLRLRKQLEYAGVKDIQKTDLPIDTPDIESLFAVMDFDDIDLYGDMELEEGDPGTNLSADFLVAGSFSDENLAMALAVRLAQSFDEVLVREKMVSEKKFSRVLFGPVEGNVEALTAKAVGLGIRQPWLLKGVTYQVEVPESQATSPMLVDEPATKPSPAVKPLPRETTAETDDTGYNPARLRAGESSLTKGK